MRIGIDLGGTKIAGLLLDERGRERARVRRATPRGSYEATLRTIADVVAELEGQTGRATGGATRDAASVGVGMPGALSPATGLVKNANSTWLNGRPLDRDLRDLLGRPVRLQNDANCFALSEATDGAAAGLPTVFGVILGTGVGGGLVVGGAVLTGRDAIAGEWGHNPLPSPADQERPGPRCYCGRSGCIETFLCGPALAADAGAPDGETAVALAQRGEAAALAAWNRWLDRLGRALAGVVNLFDPHAIVLGGGLSRIERVYEDLPDRIRPHVFSDRFETPVLPPRYGDDSGLRGAAWLWPATGAPAP